MRDWWDNLSNTLSQVATAVGTVTMLVAGWVVREAKLPNIAYQVKVYHRETWDRKPIADVVLTPIIKGGF